MPGSRMLSIVAAGLLVVSTPLLADTKAKTRDLMACVNLHLEEERAKADPSVDKLIAKCKVQYDAFVARVPRGAVDEVIADFRQQITAALKQ